MADDAELEVQSPAAVGAWAIVTLDAPHEAQAGRIVTSDAQGVTLRRLDTANSRGFPASTSDAFFPWRRIVLIERLTNRETIHRIVNSSANPRTWLLPHEQQYGFDEMGWW